MFDQTTTWRVEAFQATRNRLEIRFQAGHESNSKKIQIIFPKKPVDRIIVEVSRYYLYYFRDNPIIETLQFYGQDNSEKFEMLHEK